MATIETIMAGAKVARRNLLDLEMELAGEIDEIEVNAWNEDREITEKELKISEERFEQRKKVKHAMDELTYMTLARLNHSDELEQLTLRMNKVNNDLNGDLQTLVKIERYAATAAKITGGLARVAKRVSAIVV